MKVVLVGGNRGLGQALASQITHAKNGTVTKIARPHADLTWPEQVLYDAVRPRLPRDIDALVVSSGLSFQTGPFAPREEMIRLLLVNYLGPLTVYRACIRGLLRARGKVILVSSTVVRKPGAQWLAHYAAAKGALEAWALNEARRLAKHGVAMCVVRPGWFADGMADNLHPDTRARSERAIPMRRFGSREEVAGFVTGLLSQTNWCIAGQTYEVTGGA